MAAVEVVVEVAPIAGGGALELPAAEAFACLAGDVYEFPRETGLILRCAGKAGNPFQTTQGIRLSCRDQEARRGSEEAVPGPSVFPSGEPGVSGDFWGSQEGCQGPSRLQGGTGDFP